MAKQLEIYDTFPIKVAMNKDKKSVIMSDADGIRKDYSLVCEVDATHSGTLINNRVYPPQSMKKGIKTWTSPYKKPVLTNHDDGQDPIGRVMKAKYVKTPKAMESDEYKPVLKKSDGYGYQQLTLKITDATAIQKILDGRYETVSVRMSTDHAFCSVCNADWSTEGPCEHTPGQFYDKKLAYITTGDLSYKEMSFVNIPADEYAGVKEAILTENKDAFLSATELSIYANNSEEKVFSDLRSADDFNLYNTLNGEIEEEDDIVLHLLDNAGKIQKAHDKEDEVKLEDLTKSQLGEIKAVQELITEGAKKEVEAASVKASEACSIKVEEAKTSCQEEKDNLKSDLAACSKVRNDLNVANAGLEKEKKDLLEKNKQAANEVVKKDEDRKRVLDENIKLNSDLHKMVAERLYDLKKTLRKPDVADIKTPDERSKKVEELSQRSVDSLKDQIVDLLLEHETLLTTNYFGKKISNPGAAPSDETNEVDSEKAPKKEGKKETLNRLFSKS